MFFTKKSNTPAVRHLQKHEYLDLLQGGTHDHAVSDEIKRAALRLAQAHADSLGLEATPEPPMESIFARRSTSEEALLVHVPVKMEDCFIITVFASGASDAQAFILFDIGAEYLQPMLDCPAFGPSAPATEENIRNWVPLLPGQDSPFALIDLREGTYMQVYADQDRFHLEHQMVSTGAHYRYFKPVEAAEATEVLLSYALGKYEWAYKGWEKMDL